VCVACMCVWSGVCGVCGLGASQTHHTLAPLFFFLLGVFFSGSPRDLLLVVHALGVRYTPTVHCVCARVFVWWCVGDIQIVCHGIV
jgi:hypothetical protein